jgi:hypothetical protein
MIARTHINFCPNYEKYSLTIVNIFIKWIIEWFAARKVSPPIHYDAGSTEQWRYEKLNDAERHLVNVSSGKGGEQNGHKR